MGRDAACAARDALPSWVNLKVGRAVLCTPPNVAMDRHYSAWSHNPSRGIAAPTEWHGLTTWLTVCSHDIADTLWGACPGKLKVRLNSDWIGAAHGRR